MHSVTAALPPPLRVYGHQQVLSHLTHRASPSPRAADAGRVLYNFCARTTGEAPPSQLALGATTSPDRRYLPGPAGRLGQERPSVLLNQFPCENLLTVKDCLASIARPGRGGPGPGLCPHLQPAHRGCPSSSATSSSGRGRWAPPCAPLAETHPPTTNARQALWPPSP